ncbi:DUF6332 family protein [Streptomyces sp. NPDC056149]|uniref:DUF6332 family protein n=1 Tax=unclassified Streptomyces TaxID=2593676 RepID=UPI00238191B7|nr:DUF6332 family protein [Streptomyces sp. WZ-12]
MSPPPSRVERCRSRECSGPLTAAAWAAAVFAVALVPALAVGVAEPAGKGLLAAGGVLAATAAVWRLVRVLRRFDLSRRQGR